MQPEKPPRREVFERARLATVALGVRKEGKLIVMGAGAIIDTGGIIVTARHVLDEVEKTADELKQCVPDAARQLVVMGQTKFDDPMLDFKAHAVTPDKIGRSEKMDLAILRIKDAPIPLTALPIDFDSDPREGDDIATCGFPYGFEFHFGKSLTSIFLAGIISAVVPHPALPTDKRHHYLLQLPIHPGNSGGPVFDPITGAMIGIISSRIEKDDIPTGLSIAMPIHPMQEALSQLV